MAVLTPYPRVLIAAPQGRSGKTITCIALCACFKELGLKVQPFKKGPDYIDPSWLTAASGRQCRNLDPILMPEETVKESFLYGSGDADVALIEGAMGLYDGFDAEGTGSTAYVSRLLSCPVILVVNAARMTRSIAAMVSGYQKFEPDTQISGVILNHVSGSRHERKLVEAIEQYCGIPVVGSIPREKGLNIAERHLGLVTSMESNEAIETIERIRKCLTPHLNLDRIMAIARSAQPLARPVKRVSSPVHPTVKIGVIRDRIFSFYYPENLEALEQAGAELVFIDSTKCCRLPDIDGLYIGGGFPELYLPELEANVQLRNDIARVAEEYMPVYAECAGLMYLCRGINGPDRRYEMVGVIPGEVELCSSPQGHGYVIAQVIQDNPWFPAGLDLKGHEFHNSRINLTENVRFNYKVKYGHCIDGWDGIIYKNLLASYTHLHASGITQWAESLVSLASNRCRVAVLT